MLWATRKRGTKMKHCPHCEAAREDPYDIHNASEELPDVASATAETQPRSTLDGTDEVTADCAFMMASVFDLEAAAELKAMQEEEAMMTEDDLIF